MALNPTVFTEKQRVIYSQTVGYPMRRWRRVWLRVDWSAPRV